MRNALLRRITQGVSVLLFLFLSVPVWANRSVPVKDKALRIGFKQERWIESSSKEKAKVSLKSLSKSAARFKAPGEITRESPDSTVVYNASGEKTYFTVYQHDERNNLLRKTETAISEEGMEIVMSDQIVKYDDADRVIYNEFYERDEQGKWIGTQKASVKYDQYGNQAYYENFFWDPQKEEWRNTTKMVGEYRAKDQPNFEEEYYWTNDNKWIGTFREVSTYNAAGMLIKFDEYEWEEGWILVYQTEYRYDEVNPKTILGSTSLGLDYDTGEMVFEEKSIYIYNEKGLVDSLTYQVWDANEEKWINDETCHNKYTDGINTWQEIFRWEANAWKLNRRWEGRYDAAGRQLLSKFWNTNVQTGDLYLSAIYTYEYDGNGNKTLEQIEQASFGESMDLYIALKKIWKFDSESRMIYYEAYQGDGTNYYGTQKEEITYTGHGDDQLSYALYSWNNQENRWVNNMKEDYTYDDNNLIIAVLRSIASGDNLDEWVETGKYDFTYNEDFLRIREDYSTKNGTDWVLSVYLIYYYPSTVGMETIEDAEPDMYVSGNTLFVSGIEAGMWVRVYDVSGKLVKSVLPLGGILDLSLSQGIYVVRVGDCTAKIIIP